MSTTAPARLVVLYPAPGVSSGQLPAELHERWCYREALLDQLSRRPPWTAAPTGRYRTRETDGARGEVWAVRPGRANHHSCDPVDRG